MVKEEPTAPVFVPTHVGLTRSAVNGADGSDQTSKSKCKRCGVVQSIERHELQMPNKRAQIGPFTLTVKNSNASDESLPVPMLARSNQNLYNANNRKYDGATSFIIRLRMEDGSFRTIFEHQLPKFSIGEKVRLVNGAVISVG